MNNMQRAAIIKRRERGESINKIAKALGLNANTVKSFCRRQKINLNKTNDEACIQCGARLPGYENGRPRRFCSHKCRQAYWNAHPKRYQTDHTCPACGQAFKARRTRKYCSHACYIKDRFGDA